MITPHALRHMGFNPALIKPVKTLRRSTSLPSIFMTRKTIRRIRFRPLKHGYLIGSPSKKERVLYARQRRPEQIGRHHQSACRRIHEHWSNRSTLHYSFSARRGHWYVDNRDGTFSMKEAGRAWADNVSRFRVAT